MPRLRGADTIAGGRLASPGAATSTVQSIARWPGARDRTGQTPFRSGGGRGWSRGSANAAWWPGSMGGSARVGFRKRAGCIRLSVAG
eukprot:5523346-Prymnesium_polylepis.1